MTLGTMTQRTEKGKGKGIKTGSVEFSKPLFFRKKKIGVENRNESGY